MDVPDASPLKEAPPRLVAEQVSDRKERATVDMINLMKRRLRSAVAAQENTELPEEELMLAWMDGGCSVFLGNIGSTDTS